MTLVCVTFVGGGVTLVQHCLCARLMCFYLFWLWQVMCLEVGSGLLFSADYEGNLRSWMLDSLEVVGSVVSAHMHTHTRAQVPLSPRYSLAVLRQKAHKDIVSALATAGRFLFSGCLGIVKVGREY